MEGESRRKVGNCCELSSNLSLVNGFSNILKDKNNNVTIQALIQEQSCKSIEYFKGRGSISK